MRVEIFTTVIVAVFTVLGVYLSERARAIKLFDNMYSLFRQRYEAMCGNSIMRDEKMAFIQLQLKHLLIETRHLNFVRFSPPQLRLLADVCETLMYYEDAKAYWKKCLSKQFFSKEIEAEYYRQYAQFLYKINEDKKGCDTYREAVKMLPNDNDGRLYINVQTYINWIGNVINKSNSYTYKSYHSQQGTPDYFVPLVKDLLQDATELSEKIKNCKMQKQCFRKIQNLELDYMTIIGK